MAAITLAFDEKIGELWSTIKKVIGADVNLLNSTMRILRVLMHLSSGHVILLPWVFHPPLPNFTPNQTYGTGRPHVGLCPIFLVLTMFCYSFFFNARSPRSVGRSPRNFATWSEACSIYKCLSKHLEACPQKYFGGEKHAKFNAISDTFPL